MTDQVAAPTIEKTPNAPPETVLSIKSPEIPTSPPTPEAMAADALSKALEDKTPPHDILEGFANGEYDEKTPYSSIEDLINAMRKETFGTETLLTEYQKLFGLPEINLESDKRFKEMVEYEVEIWEQNNPEPYKGKKELSDTENNEWREWTAKKNAYRFDEAKTKAREKFQKEYHKDFEKYLRYGIYINSEGMPSLNDDPTWKAIEREANARATNRANPEKTTPNRAKAGMPLKAGFNIEIKKALKEFAQKYPEKAQIYALFNVDLAEVLTEITTNTQKQPESAPVNQQSKEQPDYKQEQPQPSKSEPSEKNYKPEENNKPDFNNQSENETENEKDPYNQIISSEEVCEYLFGIKPDNKEDWEKILKKITEDKEIIRQKYGLPPEEMLYSDPTEYERRLKKIAEELGVTIITTIELGGFFETYSGKAVFLEDSEGTKPKIGIDIDRRDKNEYINALKTLEHELIHALQHKKYPRMPIERYEYEAYAANAPTSYLAERLKEDPQIIKHTFLWLLTRSINEDYKIVNDLRKEKGLPPLIPESKQKKKKENNNED